jgi:ElaB/YqjD/DUF883 family membrane-anchored ribosome-binding protein
MSKLQTQISSVKTKMKADVEDLLTDAEQLLHLAQEGFDEKFSALHAGIKAKLRATQSQFADAELTLVGKTTEAFQVAVKMTSAATSEAIEALDASAQIAKDAANASAKSGMEAARVSGEAVGEAARKAVAAIQEAANKALDAIKALAGD